MSKNSDPRITVNYCIIWVTTSWTYITVYGRAWVRKGLKLHQQKKSLIKKVVFLPMLQWINIEKILVYHSSNAIPSAPSNNNLLRIEEQQIFSHTLLHSSFYLWPLNSVIVTKGKIVISQGEIKWSINQNNLSVKQLYR